jgi:DNA-binding MarR family transcriptional regulator
MSPSNLTAPERQVLGALIMEREAGVEDRTVESLAKLTGMHEDDVARTLEQLDSMEPKLVHRDTDETLKVEFWIALERGIAALEED